MPRTPGYGHDSDYSDACPAFRRVSVVWAPWHRILMRITLPRASVRRPWYTKFRNALSACQTLEAIEHLLRFKVQRWRGQKSIAEDVHGMELEDEEAASDKDGQTDDADEVGLDGLFLQ
jgi:hypothetical protein